MPQVTLFLRFRRDALAVANAFGDRKQSLGSFRL
jgi:hypothetical protein